MRHIHCDRCGMDVEHIGDSSPVGWVKLTTVRSISPAPAADPQVTNKEICWRCAEQLRDFLTPIPEAVTQ